MIEFNSIGNSWLSAPQFVSNTRNASASLTRSEVKSQPAQLSRNLYDSWVIWTMDSRKHALKDVIVGSQTPPTLPIRSIPLEEPCTWAWDCCPLLPLQRERYKEAKEQLGGKTHSVTQAYKATLTKWTIMCQWRKFSIKLKLLANVSLILCVLWNSILSVSFFL